MDVSSPHLEIAPSDIFSSASDRRLTDIIVKCADVKQDICVLCFVESKRPNASLSLIDEIEHQALNACVSYLSQKKLKHVYALTTYGTRARLWRRYDPPSDYLDPPLFGSNDLSAVKEYVEAHSTDAQQWVPPYEMPDTIKFHE